MNEHSWKTFCHLLPGWNTNLCCSICHAEAYEDGIEPCSVMVDERELFVCHTAWDWWQNRKRAVAV